MTLALRPHQAKALEDLPGEVWKPIDGWIGFYSVSNLGRVRSHARIVPSANRWGTITMRHIPETMLTQTVDLGRFAYGRLQVKLCGQGGGETKLVHRLVAEAFIGPCPEGLQVAHGDGDTQNNRHKNLRYATPRENSADKRVHGTEPIGETHHNAKISDAIVAEIRALKGRERLWQTATKFNISQSQVSRIQNGKQRGASL